MSDLAFWSAGPAIAARAALGAMFLRAGTAKLRDGRGFADIVGGYGLLPQRAVAPVAAALPALELAAAMLLLVSIGMPRQLGPAAGGGAMLLLGLFVGAMTMALRRGRAGVACGCRTGAAPLGWAGVGLTALLLPLAGLAALPVQAPPVWLSVQAVLAGLLMLALHDTAAQLGSGPQPAAARRRRR